jgi:hypothetical protein
MASTFLRFLDHIQRRTTVGRTPLDEWSACRRDLYLTTHNTQQTNVHAPGRIRTHNLSRQAAAVCLLFITSGHSPSDLCAIFSQYSYKVLKQDIIPSPIMARKFGNTLAKLSKKRISAEVATLSCILEIPWSIVDLDWVSCHLFPVVLLSPQGNNGDTALQHAPTTVFTRFSFQRSSSRKFLE